MSGFSNFISGLWKDIDPFQAKAVTVNQTTAAQTAYVNLLDKEQNAAKWVSSGLSVIASNITQDAALIQPLITAIDPSIDLATITNTFIGLVSSLETDQTKIPTTLVGAIQWIQAYLLPKTGNAWVTAIQGLFALGASFISPSTPVQKFLAVGEYVYQDIVIPLFHIHPSTVIPAVVAPTAAVQIPAPSPIITQATQQEQDAALADPT